MWQYFWPHAIYHLTRWFPRNNRVKIRVVIFLFTIALLVPEIFIITRESSGNKCHQHLLEMAIVSMAYTICMIGFTVLFSLMDPVPWEVKLVFHIFGLICFATGVALTVLTSLADECRESTTELYYFSVVTSVLSLLCSAYFLLLSPFWIANRVWRESVLDWRRRTGLCYEPVSCCTCLWHISDDWTERKKQYTPFHELLEIDRG